MQPYPYIYFFKDDSTWNLRTESGTASGGTVGSIRCQDGDNSLIPPLNREWDSYYGALNAPHPVIVRHTPSYTLRQRGTDSAGRRRTARVEPPATASTPTPTHTGSFSDDGHGFSSDGVSPFPAVPAPRGLWGPKIPCDDGLTVQLKWHKDTAIPALKITPAEGAGAEVVILKLKDVLAYDVVIERSARGPEFEGKLTLLRKSKSDDSPLFLVVQVYLAWVWVLGWCESTAVQPSACARGRHLLGWWCARTVLCRLCTNAECCRCRHFPTRLWHSHSHS